MSSNQERRDGNPWLMLWVYATGLVLFLSGLFITMVTPPSPGTWSRAKVGIVLLALTCLPIFIIPGMLLAMRYPWSAVHRRPARPRHPRLYGLAEAGAGLVVTGSISAILLVPDPYSPAPYWLSASNWFVPWGFTVYAVSLVTFASLMAFYLFDRRR